jgi:tetratricopeptide (TPR) repeat protein
MSHRGSPPAPWLAVCVAAAAAWVAPAAAAAQSEELGARGNTITGRIEVEGVGAPSERLEVIISRASGAGNRRVFSEPAGSFFVSGLTPGTYVLSVRPPLRTNYTEGSTEISIASNSAPNNYAITIFIRPRVAEPRAVVGRMISAQETDESVPKEARRAYKKGSEAARGRRAEEAIANYLRALEIAPDYLFALNDLGVQYTRLGRYPESIAVLERAIAEAPKSFPPHLNLAIALLGAGRLQDASREVGVALGLDATASDALYMSGVVERRLGNPEAAIAAFQSAYAQGGVDAIHAQYELGQLYEQAGQAEAAVRAYRLFLQFVQQGAHADHARQRLRALARG